MGLGCGGSCMKILLIIFNIIFFLGGAVVLGIGIWLTVDPNASEYFQNILPDESDPLWRGATILLMTVGSATFVVGFFGFCGACRENPCMLGTYGSLLGIILVGEIVGAVLAIVFQDEIESTLYASMKTQVTDVKPTYDEGSSTNRAWHAMQYDLECCGAYNYTDYNPNDFPWTETLPRTCCVLSNTDYKNPVPENSNECFTYNPQYMHTKGCYQASVEYIDSKSVILIGIGIGIGLLQIIGMIFAFCLCKEVKEDNIYA